MLRVGMCWEGTLFFLSYQIALNGFAINSTCLADTRANGFHLHQPRYGEEDAPVAATKQTLQSLRAGYFAMLQPGTPGDHHKSRAVHLC